MCVVTQIYSTRAMRGGSFVFKMMVPSDRIELSTPRFLRTSPNDANSPSPNRSTRTPAPTPLPIPPPFMVNPGPTRVGRASTVNLGCWNHSESEAPITIRWRYSPRWEADSWPSHCPRRMGHKSARRAYWRAACHCWVSSSRRPRSCSSPRSPAALVSSALGRSEVCELVPSRICWLTRLAIPTAG
jgi:hypothetical protein